MGGARAAAGRNCAASKMGDGASNGCSAANNGAPITGGVMVSVEACVHPANRQGGFDVLPVCGTLIGPSGEQMEILKIPSCIAAKSGI